MTWKFLARTDVKNQYGMHAARGPESKREIIIQKSSRMHCFRKDSRVPVKIVQTDASRDVNILVSSKVVIFKRSEITELALLHVIR